MCPRCDGKGQVITTVTFLENVLSYENSVNERIEEIDILEPCPECHSQYEGRVIYDNDGFLIWAI